jgi:hypothetical protein
MRLINTDGLALFGPGSEWFWTAISTLVLVVTVLAIYRQLRAQHTATAFAQMLELRRDWESEEMSRHALNVLVALGRSDASHVPDGSALFIGNYWETVGLLVRAGHLDLDLAREVMGVNCQWWWAALGPYFRRVRSESGVPELHEAFEWLAREMARLDRKTGEATVIDAAFVAASRPQRLRNYRDRIAVAESTRGVSASARSTEDSIAVPEEA